MNGEVRKIWSSTKKQRPISQSVLSNDYTVKHHNSHKVNYDALLTVLFKQCKMLIKCNWKITLFDAHVRLFWCMNVFLSKVLSITYTSPFVSVAPSDSVYM